METYKFDNALFNKYIQTKEVKDKLKSDPDPDPAPDPEGIHEYTIDFKGYHTDYEYYIEIIHNKFPEFKDHIGNLFYIITVLFDSEHDNVIELVLDFNIYEELDRMHYLQELLESDDETLNKFDVIVKKNHRSEPGFICSNKEVNRDLIKNILDGYKKHFGNPLDYKPQLTYKIQSEKGLSSRELLEIKNQFETSAVKYQSERIRIEKMIIGVVYSYLKEETNLIPKKNGQVPTKAADIIYYLLSIFNIITKFKEKSKRANYIIEIVRYETRIQNPYFSL